MLIEINAEIALWRDLSTILRDVKFENPDVGPINALDEIDIFVISPPKCGTTALQRGFERLGRKVLHAHNDPTTYEAFPNGNILRDAGITLDVMFRYRRALGRGPLHIFCGYRDPVGWYLSLAGQFSLPLNDALRDELVRNISQVAPWVRYSFEETRAAIEAAVGFDILTEPVDLERGYSLMRQGDVTVVLYRFDRLDSLADYIRQTIDPAFTLTRERANLDETYRHYTENFRLPRKVCESIFQGSIFSHFFSEDDRLRLIEKYSGNPGQETRSISSPDETLWSYPPEALTRALYGYLLGRQPEPAAMVNTPTIIRSSQDVTVAVRGILESDEFKLNHPRAVLAAKAHGRLGRRPRIIDVGAQTLGPGSHIYDALMRYCEVEIIGFGNPPWK
ncbi:hypothetical protein [Magnetospirillum molischianum]|uniref:hypothetical protein n=1 Tax=Magnetospirillum molischianum TaxID=1083 RepID=UPI00031D1AB4|nr:hypothetical protein [Magnetospirillum molischianum]